MPNQLDPTDEFRGGVAREAANLMEKLDDTLLETAHDLLSEFYPELDLYGDEAATEAAINAAFATVRLLLEAMLKYATPKEA